MEGTGPPPSSPDDEDKPSKQGKPEARRSKWLIYTSQNDEPDGPFDAVVATIGTCGDPIRVEFDGIEDYIKTGGRVVHSSELDSLGVGDEDNDEASTDSREGPDPGSQVDMTQAQPEEGVSYADKVKNADEHSEESTVNVDAGDEEPKEQGGPLNVRGKTVAIVGSGASGVEAAEWAVEKGAGKVYLLAR